MKELSVSAELEQCAEECSELTQACLKLSRLLRGENPTPVSKAQAIANVTEEVADVGVCLIALIEKGVVSESDVNRIAEEKIERRNRRLEMAEKGE